MDVFWLAVVLASWRVLTREYWRTRSSLPTRVSRAWFGRWLPERGLVALYRATFFYGLCRLIAWTRGTRGRRSDDRRNRARRLPAGPLLDRPVVVVGAVVAARQRVVRRPRDARAAVLVYWAVSKLWEPMGRAEAANASATQRIGAG